jgi:ATP-dependent DNA helicase RecG
MKDFVSLFEDKLSRKQVRTRVEKFVLNESIEQQGSIYKISDEYIKKMEVFAEAFSKTISDLENKNEMAKKRPKKDQ